MAPCSRLLHIAVLATLAVAVTSHGYSYFPAGANQAPAKPQPAATPAPAPAATTQAAAQPKAKGGDPTAAKGAGAGAGGGGGGAESSGTNTTTNTGHTSDTEVVIEVYECANDDTIPHGNTESAHYKILDGKPQFAQYRAQGHSWYDRKRFAGMRRMTYNDGPCPIGSRELMDLYNELDHVLLENEWLRHQVLTADNGKGQPAKAAPWPIRQKLVISFTAKATKDQVFAKDNQTIVFDQVIDNTGDAYNATTGTFTCPVNGTYIFSGTILSDLNSTIETSITADGNEVLPVYSGSYGNRGSGSATAVVSLTEGTDVCMAAVNGHGKIVHGKWSSFSGALLKAH